VRELVGEIVLYAAVCLVGAVFVFVWRTHPTLALLTIAVFAIATGWFGYLYRRLMDPESSRTRRLRTAAFAAGLAAFDALAVWAPLCSCN
jgi:multisubunit Na+/H+ antiporter MnhB subunit